MNLTIIVPVRNGGDDLRRCLQALVHSDRAPDELLVVDDASTDESAGVARSVGATVLALAGGPHGPAVARNRAAAIARGDILVFVDADVVVHRDSLSRIEVFFDSNSNIDALFGSYDDAPADRGVISRYKNLLHHYVHQRGNREAGTFWAGLGAVRRTVFLAVGGFDEAYARPSIEDIEVGMRMRRAGHRIALCPDIQATHLKRWTFSNLPRTDIFARAVPWTRLLLRSDERLPNDLNLDLRSRVGAAAVLVAVALVAPGVRFPIVWAGIPLALAVFAACNAGLLRFFLRTGGIPFALGAAALHALYLLYSSMTFAALTAQWHIEGAARRGPRRWFSALFSERA